MKIIDKYFIILEFSLKFVWTQNILRIYETDMTKNGWWAWDAWEYYIVLYRVTDISEQNPYYALFHDSDTGTVIPTNPHKRNNYRNIYMYVDYDDKQGI
jgi:hypothetical protein